MSLWSTFVIYSAMHISSEISCDRNVFSETVFLKKIIKKLEIGKLGNTLTSTFHERQISCVKSKCWTADEENVVKGERDTCRLEVNIQHSPFKVCYPIFHFQRVKEKLHTKVGTYNVIVMLFLWPTPPVDKFKSGNLRQGTYTKVFSDYTPAITLQSYILPELQDIHLVEPCF